MSGVSMLVSLLFLMGWKPPPGPFPFSIQHIDRQEATIGDRIHFTVNVFTASDQKVMVPEDTPVLGGFVVKQRDINEKQRKGMNVTTIRYELVSYDVRCDTIAEIAFGVLSGDDTVSVLTEPVAVEIKSVAPEMTGQEDIRPLRPQVGMRIPVWQYLLILAAIGALVGGVLFFVWRRGRVKGLLPMVARPPWDEALAALEELSHQGISSPDEIKRFYTSLSYILRDYCEKRFFFPAVEHTTTEILERIKHIDELQPFIDRTGELLMKSDLVKFAQYLPEKVDNDQEIGMVREIVEFTKEREEEEETKETEPVDA